VRAGRYSQKQKADFEARFRQTKRYQVAAAVPVAGAVLLVVGAERYAADLGPMPVMLGAAFLVLVAAGFSWRNWRCPACRTFLGTSLNPSRCPGCGLRLD
jgi:rubrerythrin